MNKICFPNSKSIKLAVQALRGQSIETFILYIFQKGMSFFMMDLYSYASCKLCDGCVRVWGVCGSLVMTL